MNNQSQKKVGKFFGGKREYTRHIRAEDELLSEEPNSIYDMQESPFDKAPEISVSRRSRLSKLDPVDDALYEDPTGDRAPMNATSDEILQFGQDITSKEFRSALQKKLGINSNPLDELFLDDREDEDHEAPAVSTTSTTESVKGSKNSRRKKRREKKKHTQLIFTGVPKVPETKFDHFYHIPPDRVETFKKEIVVKECLQHLVPYLHLLKKDWIEKNLRFEDIIAVGLETGLYFVKTHRGVEGKYIVHIFSDTKPPSDEQLQDYDIMLFLVCGKLKDAECYCILNFFFIKSENF